MLAEGPGFWVTQAQRRSSVRASKNVNKKTAEAVF
jgi:hypothetical protein